MNNNCLNHHLNKDCDDLPKVKFIYCMGMTGPTGPAGPASGSTGPTGPTGPSGSTSGFNTYMMATNNTKQTYSSASPFSFNNTTLANNITYSNGTFTINNAGQYLFSWASVIKNERPTDILSIGLYNLSPNNSYINYSNTGNTISNNQATFLSGVAIVNATAGSTYQLRNASSNSILIVPNNQMSSTLTIIRIN